ncbi:hypothetical protein ATK30_0644 [Amycolatopsis echigonensis]|uniref:Ig-like domain-containing protein n=1 Tax=Amycolatopsis echigonensis TaxID=2576905 RepID=A0A2N3X0M2_9PSEU|nr:hypothetical protein [Amycolatopsis niigatensis]PKV99662.1 hypothetical protein ATK30_0644 [Amycolatopsis niigatensis]
MTKLTFCHQAIAVSAVMAAAAGCGTQVTGPVTITVSRGGIGPLAVRKINADSVEVSMAVPLGPTVKKGCTASFCVGGDAAFQVTWGSDEPRDMPGTQVKRLVTVKSSAVLDLKSAP